MRELPITTRTTCTQNGQPITLHYIILVEDTPDGLENYGIKITEEETSASASVPGLTMSSERIYHLIEVLANGTVTAVGLRDILADWL